MSNIILLIPVYASLKCSQCRVKETKVQIQLGTEHINLCDQCAVVLASQLQTVGSTNKKDLTLQA